MAAVELHIYDVTSTQPENSNAYITRFNAIGKEIGLGGIFHGGISVHGEEYSYGYCERGTGVYACVPRDNPMYSYRESLTLGATTKSPFEVKQLIAQLKDEWRGADYDIMSRNCNHFCNDLAAALGVSQPPGWVNRIAYASDTVLNFTNATVEQAKWVSSATSAWLQSWVGHPQASAVLPGEVGTVDKQ